MVHGAWHTNVVVTKKNVFFFQKINPYIHGKSFQIMAQAPWTIPNQILGQSNKNVCNMYSHELPKNV